MPDNDTTSDALPGGEQTNVAPSDGEGAVNDKGLKLSGVKDIISQITGKKFPTDEAAVKSVQDTFSFVGGAGMKISKRVEEYKQKFNTDENGILKLMESITQNPQNQPITPPAPASAPAVDPGVVAQLSSTQKQVEEMQFFDEKPEYKNYRGEIRELRDATGKPIRDVVEMPAFKKLFDKAKSHDEAERSRSVLHSNPQLGQVRDKITEAAEAAKAGDFNKARESAVGAVVASMQG